MSSAVAGSLSIHPKSANLEGDVLIDSKTSSYVEILFNGERKSTENAINQGKSPAWTTKLNFTLTDKDLDTPDIQIIVDVYIDNGKGVKELFGRGSLKFSEIRKQSQIQKAVSIYDKKGKGRGSVQFDITLKKDLQVLQSQKPSNVSKSKKLEKGTLVVQPKTGRLKKNVDLVRKVDPCVVVVVGEQALRTNSAEEGSYPTWKDVLSFEMKGSEEYIVFRVIDLAAGPTEDPLGEAIINIEDLTQALVDNSAEITIDLELKGKGVGQLTIEFDFLNDLFTNPVKLYPIMEIKRGEYICKKIRYSNPDNIKKTIKIFSVDKANLVQPRVSDLVINPKSYVDIRVKIFAPGFSKQATSRLDIFVEELNQIEESLVFQLLAI